MILVSTVGAREAEMGEGEQEDKPSDMGAQQVISRAGAQRSALSVFTCASSRQYCQPLYGI